MTQSFRGDLRLSLESHWLDAVLPNGVVLHVKDASRSGLFLLAWDRVSMGDTANFTLRSNTQEIPFSLQVTSKVMRSDASGAGMQFVWANEQEENAWIDFFSKLCLLKASSNEQPNAGNSNFQTPTKTAAPSEYTLLKKEERKPLFATSTTQNVKKLTVNDPAEFSVIYHREIKNGVLVISKGYDFQVGQPVIVHMRVSSSHNVLSKKQSSFVLSGKILRLTKAGDAVIKLDAVRTAILEQMSVIAGRNPTSRSGLGVVASEREEQSTTIFWIIICLFLFGFGVWLKFHKGKEQIEDSSDAMVTIEDAPRFRFTQDIKFDPQDIPYVENGQIRMFSVLDLDYISYEPLVKKYTFYLKGERKVEFTKDMAKDCPPKLLQAMLELNPNDPTFFINKQVEQPVTEEK